VIVAAVLGAAVPAGAAAYPWAAGPNSAQAHESGVSAQLSDGSVFVAAGGGNSAATNAEVLAADGSAFAPAGQITQTRFYAAAALLPDGRVLIAGGDDVPNESTPVPATAEVWSSTGGGTFTATGPMNVPRQVFTLTALPNGQVLAVGGSPDFGNQSGSATAELYNPMTNAWTLTGLMAAGRYGQTATLLPDCRVLIVGDNPTAEAYNYVTGAFSPAGSEGSFQRSYQTATLLASGKVLIAGGVDVNNNPLDTASVYDPASGTFTPTANHMSTPHSQGFAARLSDGRVIVGGGFSVEPMKPNPGTVTDNVDIYDPSSNSWSSAASMSPNSFAVSVEAATLNNGNVIVIGAGPTATSSEIYTPSSLGPPVSPPAENCSGLSSGGGSGGGGGTSGGGGGGTTPVTLTVRAVKANSTGTIRVTVTTNGAGRLTAVASRSVKRKGRRAGSRPYGRASATVPHAETLKVTIAAGPQIRALLRAGKTLAVTVVIRLTPSGSSKVVRLTVRGRRPRSRQARPARRPLKKMDWRLAAR
jgi:Kelch motif